jgi:hypothetical protein
VIGILQPSGMIAVVSLRLLYLIFQQVLGLLLLIGRTASTKDIELAGDGPAPWRCYTRCTRGELPDLLRRHRFCDRRLTGAESRYGAAPTPRSSRSAV